MRARFIFKYVKNFAFIILTALLFKILYESIQHSNKKVIISTCKRYNNDLITFSNYYNDKHSENNEWEPLNKFVYLRYKAYYYKAESIIRVLALSKAVFDYKISCFLEINDEKNLICLDTKYKTLRSYEKYGAYAIDCILPKTLNLYDHHSVKVYLYNHDYEFRTRRAFTVDLTNSFPRPQSILLCSKQYNFSFGEYENTKYWIDYNLNLGYDKIILFNNSIPNVKFYDLFSSYGNRVEVKKYKYFPFLYLNERDNPGIITSYYYHLKFISRELRRVHERLAINECYCDNRLKFLKISVLDNDEIIIPRSLVSPVNNSVSTTTCERPTNLTVYLNDLNEVSNEKFKHSYWFIYARMMKNEFLKDFMRELGDALINSKVKNEFPFEFKLKNKIGVHGIQHIKFTFDKLTDYDYAQYLLDTYKEILVKHADFFQIHHKSSRFNRLLTIILHYTFKENGKSIHFTKDVLNVGHHEANDFKLEKVKYKMGYVSHFRNTFYYYGSSINIRSVLLDLNHLNCYHGKQFL
jgi:hypothetical protein